MGMGTTRDSQRERVYESERAAFAAITDSEMTMEECAAFLADVQRRPWFRTRWGNRTITVRPTHGYTARGTHNGTNIWLPAGMRRRSVCLHELAHNLSPYGVAAHGPEFAGLLLFLVQQMHGREVAQRLREEFRTHRVRRSRAAIPAPTQAAATVTAQRAKQRDAERQPLTPADWQTLERLLDRAIKSGAMGATGTAARTRAMAVRRAAGSQTPDGAAARAAAVRIGSRGRR